MPKKCKVKKVINFIEPFHATGLFLYPVMTPKPEFPLMTSKPEFLLFSWSTERDQWYEMG